MRTNFRYSLLAAIAFVAVSTSTAAAAAPAWFEGADRDGDSRLTWNEYLRGESKFDILDENGDGIVTEFDRFLADGEVESSWVYAESMDVNGNGAVTQAEYRSQLRATFDLYDRDGDGALSEREADAPTRVRSADGNRSGGRGFAERITPRS